MSGDFSYVLSVGGTLPTQRFELVSLRQAIEMTLAQASSTADYYVDMLGKLHVYTSETNDAPKNIDADAPGAGEIAPENLRLEYDSNAYANRVYVQGANPTASGYFQDDAAIAAASGLVRTAVVQASDCTTAAMASSLGTMYLGRVKAAKPRGSFSTSSAKADGWRGGQNVLITSAAHGLSAQSYRIARVTTRVTRPGVSLQRAYDVEFGGARAGSSERSEPIIAGATAGVWMLDQLGNQIISNAASASSGGIGPAVRRYIQSGVYNGDFAAPPPGPDAPIDDATNPLPYWSVFGTPAAQDSILWFPDPTAPSGHVLRINIGNAGTTVLGVSQMIPVMGNRGGGSVIIGKTWVQNSGTTTNTMSVWITGLYYKADGVTPTGSGSTLYTKSLATMGLGGSSMSLDAFSLGRVPSDAYYFDLGIYLQNTFAAATGQVDISDVWLEQQWAPAPKGAMARRTTNLAGVVTATWAPIPMDDSPEVFDILGMHSTGTNPSRFTVPVGWDGVYQLTGHTVGSAAMTPRILCGWMLNGADPTGDAVHAYNQSAVAGSVWMECSVIMELAAGDYVEFAIWHNTGSNQTSANPHWASVMWLADRLDYDGFV
jgi:hypothetical protein